MGTSFLLCYSSWNCMAATSPRVPSHIVLVLARHSIIVEICIPDCNRIAECCPISTPISFESQVVGI